MDELSSVAVFSLDRTSQWRWLWIGERIYLL